MSYIKNTWQDGDIITAEKLNNIENEIENKDNIFPFSVGYNEEKMEPYTTGSITGTPTVTDEGEYYTIEFTYNGNLDYYDEVVNNPNSKRQGIKFNILVYDDHDAEYYNIKSFYLTNRKTGLISTLDENVAMVVESGISSSSMTFFIKKEAFNNTAQWTVDAQFLQDCKFTISALIEKYNFNEKFVNELQKANNIYYVFFGHNLSNDTYYLPSFQTYDDLKQAIYDGMTIVGVAKNSADNYPQGFEVFSRCLINRNGSVSNPITSINFLKNEYFLDSSQSPAKAYQTMIKVTVNSNGCVTNNTYISYDVTVLDSNS